MNKGKGKEEKLGIRKKGRGKEGKGGRRKEHKKGRR